jgi:hypothetical protein
VSETFVALRPRLDELQAALGHSVSEAVRIEAKVRGRSYSSCGGRADHAKLFFSAC